MKRLKLPTIMNSPACLDFAIATPGYYTYPEDVVIDLSKLRWSFPLGTLVVGSAIRRLIQVRSSFKLATRFEGINLSSNQCQSYIAHIGFFDYIGLDHGARIGSASGSSSYIPIRALRVSDIMPNISKPSDVASKIDSEANDLASVLVGRFNNSEFRVVSYVLREALRNAVEHSGADEAYFCAQRWKDGRVQIAILDEGSGVCFSLRQSYPDLDSDAKALEAAVKPGVSRVSTKPESHNLYGNSGYGLYVMSELGKSFGIFSIASGNSCYVVSKSAREHRPSCHSGTFLGLHLTTSPANFAALLEDIVSAGEYEAEGQQAIRKASQASKSSSL